MLARRPAAVPELVDGRVRRQGGRRAGRAADRRQGRRRPSGGADARRPARRSRSRPAASCRRAPTRWSRSSGSSCGRSEIEIAETVVSGDNIRRARRRRPRRRHDPRRRGSCSRRRGSRALAACGIESVQRVPSAHASRSSSPAPSCGRRASRSSRARSTSRTGSCSRRRCEAAGAVVERLAAAEDTEEALEQALERALAADVVVTSGGVSVGPHDLVRRVEARLGVEEVFWGVAMRPGKPLAFGVRGRDARVRPAREPGLLARRLPAVRPAGAARAPGPPRSRAAVSARARSRPRCAPRPERDDFVRARIAWSEAGPLLDPIVGQESHMIVQTTAADAIVHVPRGTEPLAAGRARRLPAAVRLESRAPLLRVLRARIAAPPAGSGPPRARRAGSRPRPRRSGRAPSSTG